MSKVNPKTDILQHGYTSVFNNWASAAKWLSADRKKTKDPLNAYHVSAYYITNADDPYADNLDYLGGFQNVNNDSGLKWTVRSLTANELGDLGNIKDMDSDRQSYSFAGMSHAIIQVSRKTLWLNSNGAPSWHVPQIEPLDADTVAGMLLHMPGKGMNLMSSGSRKIHIPLKADNRFITDPYYGRDIRGKGITIWRETQEYKIGKELLAKIYMQNVYGLDVKRMREDKGLSKYLSQRYDIPIPSTRRIKTEYERTVIAIASGEATRQAIIDARKAQTKRKPKGQNFEIVEPGKTPSQKPIESPQKPVKPTSKGKPAFIVQKPTESPQKPTESKPKFGRKKT